MAIDSANNSDVSMADGNIRDNQITSRYLESGHRVGVEEVCFGMVKDCPCCLESYYCI